MPIKLIGTTPSELNFQTLEASKVGRIVRVIGTIDTSFHPERVSNLHAVRKMRTVGKAMHVRVRLTRINIQAKSVLARDRKVFGLWSRSFAEASYLHDTAVSVLGTATWASHRRFTAISD